MTNSEIHQKLTNADNLQKALVEHFLYLADSDNGHSLLETVMGKAEDVNLVMNQLVVYFANGNTLTCGEPAEAECEKFPQSFQKMVGTHEYINFDDQYGGFMQLGDCDFPEKIKDADFKNSDADVLCPFADDYDWWVYHPTKKNPQGEPLLCKISHEDMKIEKTADCNIGSLFLKVLDEWLKDAEAIAEEEAKKPSESKKTEMIKQALSETKIGFTNTLIKQKCQCALYLGRDKKYKNYKLLAFYPDGVYQQSGFEILNRRIIELYGEEFIDFRGDEENKIYAVWSGSKKVKNTQPCNKIEILWASVDYSRQVTKTEITRLGGWDSDGNLILSSVNFDNEAEIQEYKYVGCVKDGKVVFSDDCGIAE